MKSISYTALTLLLLLGACRKDHLISEWDDPCSVVSADTSWFPLTEGSRWSYDQGHGSPYARQILGTVFFNSHTYIRNTSYPYNSSAHMDYYRTDSAGNIYHWWWSTNSDSLLLPAHPQNGMRFGTSDSIICIDSTLNSSLFGCPLEHVLIVDHLNAATRPSRSYYKKGIGLIIDDWYTEIAVLKGCKIAQ